MAMKSRVLVFLVSGVLSGCATEGGMQGGASSAGASAQTAAPAAQIAPVAKPAAPAAPAARQTMTFSDLPNFDSELAKSLNGAQGPVIVTSADRVTLRQIPPRLEKWLAAVDDSGGKIEAQPVDPAAEPQTRSLGLVISLIGAIREARSFARAQIYNEARNFDAKIFYRLDSSGDRVMDRVEWIRRQR